MDIFEQDAEVAQAEMETSSTAITEDLEAMWQQEVRALSDRKRELSESEAHLADGRELIFRDLSLADTTLSDLDLTLDLNRTGDDDDAMRTVNSWDEQEVPEPVETLLRQSLGSSPVEYGEFQAFAAQERQKKRKQVHEIIDLTEDTEDEDEVVEVGVKERPMERRVGESPAPMSVGGGKTFKKDCYSNNLIDNESTDGNNNHINGDTTSNTVGSPKSVINDSAHDKDDENENNCRIVNAKHADPERLFGGRLIRRTYLVEQDWGYYCKVLEGNPMTAKDIKKDLSRRKTAPKSLLKPRPRPPVQTPVVRPSAGRPSAVGLPLARRLDRPPVVRPPVLRPPVVTIPGDESDRLRLAKVNILKRKYKTKKN